MALVLASQFSTAACSSVRCAGAAGAEQAVTARLATAASETAAARSLPVWFMSAVPSCRVLVPTLGIPARRGIGPRPPDPFRAVQEKASGLTLMPAARSGARLEFVQFVQPDASILIVDDHDGFRTFARGMLEADGFTVAEAATGAEAAETARSVRPGLVLLDIQLPDFDGFEVARRLAAQAGGSAQAGGPVIVLTSTRDASDYGGRIGSSPVAGFLPKDELSGAALRRFLAAGA